MILGRHYRCQIPDCSDVSFKDCWSTTDTFIPRGPQAGFHVPDDVALIDEGTRVDVLANVTSREELKVAHVRTHEPQEPSVFMTTKFNHDCIGIKRRRHQDHRNQDLPLGSSRVH